MINNDNQLLDSSYILFSVASRASEFQFSVARENFNSPGASGRVYSHALQWGFRRAALSAIFGLSCIVKAEFCLSCIVQGIWPWSVKVKIMLVVHRARTLSSCTVQRFWKENTQKVNFPGGFVYIVFPKTLHGARFTTSIILTFTDRGHKHCTVHNKQNSAFTMHDKHIF